MIVYATRVEKWTNKRAFENTTHIIEKDLGNLRDFKLIISVKVEKSGSVVGGTGICGDTVTELLARQTQSLDILSGRIKLSCKQ